MAKILALKEPKGIIIEGVEPNSPAEKAGIRSAERSAVINGTAMMLGGDVIIGMGGNIVENFTDVISTLQNSKVGDSLNLTIIRNDQKMNINLILAEKPEFLELLGKGDALYELERYQEAMEYYDKALRLDPNDTYALAQ